MALLLYLAVGGTVSMLAGRGSKPMRPSSVAVILLLPLIFTGEALFTGRAYGPLDMPLASEPLSTTEAADGHRVRNHMSADIPFQIVPWHAAVRAAWAEGAWPLWNPFMMGGDALAATAQAAPFHPFNLLALLLPLHQSLGFLSACTFFVAALGGFLFARELLVAEDPRSEAGSRREIAALIGATAFAFSGFVVSWLGWPMGLAAAHLPFVFYAVRRLVGSSTDQARSIVRLAIVLASALHAGHPETASHLVMAGGVYGLFELVSSRPDGNRHRILSWMGRKTALAFGGGLLAALLAAISLLPILDALPQTAQFEGRRQAFADADHSVPLREAFGRARTAAIPFVYGLPWTESAPTATFFVPTSSAYVGSTLFALVLLGLVGHGWKGRWLLAFFAGFGIAAGASAPGVTHLLARLPLLDISIHKRWVMLAAFALAMLAALGADVLSRGPENRFSSGRLARFGKWADLTCHLLPLLVVLGLLGLSWNRLRTSGFSDAFLSRNLLLLLVPPILVLGLHLGPRLRRLQILGKRASTAGASRRLMAILVLLILQRAGEAADRYPALDPAEVYPSVPILGSLAELEAARTADSTNPSPWRFVATGELMPPNLGSLYGLEDVRGYQPMALRSYVGSYGLWTSGGDAYFHRVRDLERPFLDLLGVRWALDRDSDTEPIGWRTVARQGEHRLLENLEALERVFVPRQVRIVDRAHPADHLRSGPADAMASIEARPYDGASPSEWKPGLSEHGGSVGDGPEILHWGYEPRFRIRLESPTWLVIAEPAWRGWRARATAGPLEGEDLPVHRANLTFLALRLPAGEHQVALEYEPRSFVLGLGLGGIGILASALLLLGPVRPGRAAVPRQSPR